MLFRSPRERSLWLLAAGYTLVIYLSLGWVRAVTDPLRERNLLRLVIVLLFVVAAVAIVAWMLRRRAGRREWAVLAATALAYAALLPLARRAEEQLHLLQYGLLGGLIYAALAERRRARGEPPAPSGAVWAAFLLTALLGWIDEGIQDLLPGRYYGLQDVVINAIAGGLAATALAALARVRQQQPAPP